MHLLALAAASGAIKDTTGSELKNAERLKPNTRLLKIFHFNASRDQKRELGTLVSATSLEEV